MKSYLLVPSSVQPIDLPPAASTVSEPRAGAGFAKTDVEKEPARLHYNFPHFILNNVSRVLSLKIISS